MEEYILRREKAIEFNTNIWEKGKQYWIIGDTIRGVKRDIYEIEGQRFMIEQDTAIEKNERIEVTKINFPDSLKKTLEKLTGVILN